MKSHDHPTIPSAGAGFRHWCGSVFRTSLAALAAAVTVSTASADYLVDFEAVSKAAYASGTVKLNGLDWNMTEALIGGSDVGDFKNGSKSARLRGYGTSAMTMTEDKANGLGTLSFEYRRFSSEAQVAWVAQYSTTAGASWTQIGAPFTAAATVATFSETVNVEGSVRIRILPQTLTGSSNRRMNIDDILLTDFGAPVLDEEPPVIVTTSPADESSDVSIDTTLAITFDETVVAAAGNIELYETGNPTPVASLPTSSASVAGPVATFTLPAALEHSTDYHVLLDTTSFEDTSGNALVSGITDPTVWNFTTADAPPPVGTALATWDFTGATGDQESQPVSVTVSGITAADVTRGEGITASAAGGSISSKGWSTGALDSDDYYEFAVTINAATTSSLNTIAFAERRSGTGIREFALRSSLDEFATNIATVNVPDDDATRDQSISLPGSFSGLSGTTVTFRLYGYSAEAGTGTWRIANHTDFSGLVVTGFSGPSDPNAPPALTAFSPTGSGQPTAPTLSLTFSKDVTAGSGAVVIHNASDDSVVQTLPASSATINGSTATFDVTGLSAATSYYVLVGADAFEDNLNQFYAGLQDTAAWTFATVDPAPVVIALLPADEDSEVAGENLLFAIQYDRDVVAGAGIIQVVDAFDPLTVVATFDVADSAEVLVSGNLLSTVVPVDLPGGFTYDVLVPAGAVLSDDVAAAPSVEISGFEWIFTTVLPDETPPGVEALSPPNGVGGAPISGTLQVTFDEEVELAAGPWSIEVEDLTNGATGFIFTEADITNVAATANLLTITPPAPFTELTDYRVTLTAGVVKDLAGNTSAAIGGVGEWEFTTAGPFVAGNVVISQVYGGGGNDGATLTHDFVELHNLSEETVFVTGWSVQYASAAGSTWSVTPLTGSIPPGGYYLVQQAAGKGGTVALPTPDAIGSAAMGAGSGKVALVGNSTALAVSDPLSDPLLQISDFVGYGTASAFEGTGAAPVISATLAALRKVNGSVDTDDNAADFVTGDPTPRNKDSSPFFPTVDGSGIASAVNAGAAAGTLSNLPLFISAGSGQTLAVTVTGTADETVTDVVVELPTDFGAPLIGNVSLSGPAAATAMAMVSGQSIIVSDAAVTTSDSLTVTVSGLTAPDASIDPADSGVRSIGVLTAATGGTPASIVAPPAVTSVVPVATVSTLRALPTDGIKTYLVVPEVVVTYATPTLRNQHWVQDSTAGIVIDDPAFVLTPFAAGSGVTGLVGKLVLFNGLLELTPSVNAGQLTSTGNTPAPLVVSLEDLIADPIAYQARLVRVNGVILTTPSGTYGEGIEHPIALAANEEITFNLRTFFDTGYEDSPLETEEFDLVGLIQTRNVTLDSFISPRSPADFIIGGPEPTPAYSDWAADFAGNQAANLDFDGDGVPNGVEYFFGVTTAGFTPTPGIENGSITFPRDSSLTDVSFVVQTSGDLEAWEDVPVENLNLTDPNFIKYVLPAPAVPPAPFFVRIKVTVAAAN
jgi:hypothetical protein